LLRADQIRVPAVDSVRCQIGVDLLCPTTVGCRVVFGFPRGEHLHDEVPLANAECRRVDGHTGRRAVAMMDGDAAVRRRSGVAGDDERVDRAGVERVPGIHDHARHHRRDRMQTHPHRGDHAEVSAAAA
jgi:hypothetical protein